MSKNKFENTTAGICPQFSHAENGKYRCIRLLEKKEVSKRLLGHSVEHLASLVQTRKVQCAANIVNQYHQKYFTSIFSRLLVLLRMAQIVGTIS